MPATLLHLVAVEQLAAHPGGLPAEVARALAEDLPYSRFGAALLDLPYYAGLSDELVRGFFGGAPRVPPFARLLHTAAPVAVGLKLAELVARGALVGREPGLAVVTGYFTHLAFDLALKPVLEQLVPLARRPAEHPAVAQRRVEWSIALGFAREITGRELLGTADFTARHRILKRTGLPIRGIGRGLYELFRTACADVLGPAPKKREVDGWVRGLYLFGKALGSPLGRRLPLALTAPEEERVLRGSGVDVPAVLAAALERARGHAGRIAWMIGRGDFSSRSRTKFFAELPEESLMGPA